MQQVPQYIDVEDKVAGPLTWKHLWWFFGAGGILLLLWNTLDSSAFWIFGSPIIVITVAFAFYRPSGVSLATFVGYALTYFFKPRIYLWHRNPIHKKAKKQKHGNNNIQEKSLALDEIIALSETLDTHGEEKSKIAEDLIKKNLKNKR